MKSFIVAAIAATASALYEGLIELNEDNFDQLVTQDDQNMWVVTFYADWCPYALAFEHEIMVTSRNMMTAGYDIKFGAVNVADNLGLVHHYGVDRSPTIEIFSQDKERPTRYGGTRTHEAMDIYLQTEAPYEGYDRRLDYEGKKVKVEYDVKRLERDIYQANDERTGLLGEMIEKAIEKEVELFEETKIELDKRFQGMIDDLVGMRDEAMEVELERHTDTMERLQDQYEEKVDIYERQNDSVVHGLRNAYLVDYDLDMYLDNQQDGKGMAYLSKFDVRDYETQIAYHDPYAEDDTTEFGKQAMRGWEGEEQVQHQKKDNGVRRSKGGWTTEDDWSEEDEKWLREQGGAKSTSMRGGSARHGHDHGHEEEEEEEHDHWYGEEEGDWYGDEVEGWGDDWYGDEEGDWYGEEEGDWYGDEGDWYGDEGDWYGDEEGDWYGDEGDWYGDEEGDWYGEEGGDWYGEEDWYGDERDWYGMEDY